MSYGQYVIINLGSGYSILHNKERIIFPTIEEAIEYINELL